MVGIGIKKYRIGKICIMANLDALEKRRLGLQRKKFKIKARQIPWNAAYRGVRKIPRDAAQRRYWTFCVAIKS
jgi:hypothetical protein